MKMIKVSDYVVSFLEKKRIRHIFMLSGGGSMHLNDSFGRSKKIKYICILHEQAAAIAAEAYARMSENFGAALVTTGPGSTNAITGVVGAWTDSIPCFIVSGQVKRADIIGEQGLRINGYQEAEIIKLVKPVTKYAEIIMEPNDIGYHLEKAYYLMMSNRPGPVWLDIPLDVQAAMIDEKKLRHFNSSEIEEEERENGFDRIKASEQAEEVLKLLKNAKRPVFLAGNGIRLAHAMKEFDKLIQELKIPILTTWGAIDFLDENHPLNFGRPNMLGGNRAANFILQNADLILAIGARLGVQQIGYNYKAFAREAKLVMVDIDKQELDKRILNPFIKVHADAGFFMKELISKIGQNENNKNKKNKAIIQDLKWWIEWCRNKKQKYPVVLPEYYKQKDYANSYVFVNILSEELSKNDVLTPSSSATAYVCTSQAFKIKKGQRFLTSRGMASMGWDLPSAIGACLASGKRRTICVTGDGSIQLNIQELQTIISNNLPIKIFMLNNRGYLTIKNTQRNYFNCHYVGCNKESGLYFPDMIKVANAYGFPTFMIKSNKEIRDVVKKALATKGPAFCEIIMSPDQQIIPRLASRKKKDGSMVSSPLEDLYPFLERQEFNENMIIKPYEG